MLIAKHWQESILYRAADAFERAGDWQTMGPKRSSRKAPHKK
jgi:Asp-tRNA(Asn)/Glu-tRNA(Gln) amidotransferase A subunit family amidase